jgi:hypothetical protein
MDSRLEFMAGITKHLNELNLYLQAKNKLIISIYGNVKAFQTKLSYESVNLQIVKLLNPYLCKVQSQPSTNGYSQKN